LVNWVAVVVPTDEQGDTGEGGRGRLVNWVAVMVPTDEQDNVAGGEGGVSEGVDDFGDCPGCFEVELNRFDLLHIGETNWVARVRLANTESRFG